jgi:hypothetical protein
MCGDPLWSHRQLRHHSRLDGTKRRHFQTTTHQNDSDADRICGSYPRFTHFPGVTGNVSDICPRYALEDRRCKAGYLKYFSFMYSVTWRLHRMFLQRFRHFFHIRQILCTVVALSHTSMKTSVSRDRPAPKGCNDGRERSWSGWI